MLTYFKLKFPVSLYTRGMENLNYLAEQQYLAAERQVEMDGAARRAFLNAEQVSQTPLSDLIRSVFPPVTEQRYPEVF